VRVSHSPQPYRQPDVPTRPPTEMVTTQPPEQVYAVDRSAPAMTGPLPRRFTLSDGRQVDVRPVRPSDKEGMCKFVRELGDESTIQRFCTNFDELPPYIAKAMVEVDQDRHVAVVAQQTADGETTSIVAEARYVLLEEQGVAELAMVVADEWQGAGLGRQLRDHLIEHARAQGVTKLVMEVATHNTRLRRSLKGDGAGLEGGRFTLDLGKQPGHCTQLQTDFLGAVAAGKVWSRSLKDGTTVTLRCLGPQDVAIVETFLRGLPDAALGKRFGRELVSHSDIQRFVTPPTVALMAWVGDRPAGLVDRTPQQDSVGAIEIGLVVHPDHQGKGLGTALFLEMAALGKAENCSQIVTPVLTGNSVIRAYLAKVGATSSGPWREDPRYTLYALPLSSALFDLPPVNPADMH
jgi:acetyltransferase